MVKHTKEAWDLATSMLRVDAFIHASSDLYAAQEEVKRCRAALTEDDECLLHALARKAEEVEAAKKCIT